MALYTITPEGRDQPSDELGILDMVKERPTEDSEVAEAVGQPVETTKKYLDYYVSQGWMTKSGGVAQSQQYDPIADLARDYIT